MGINIRSETNTNDTSINDGISETISIKKDKDGKKYQVLTGEENT